MKGEKMSRVKRIFAILMVLVITSTIFVPANVNAATKKNQTLTVLGSKEKNVKKTINIFDKKTFSLKAKAKTKITYKTSNKKIATVNSKGKVTLKKQGKVKITISAAASKKYKKVTHYLTLSVIYDDHKQNNDNSGSEDDYTTEFSDRGVFISSTGKEYKAGDTIPLSEFKSKYCFRIDGVDPSGCVWSAEVATVGNGVVDPDFAYDTCFTGASYKVTDKSDYVMYYKAGQNAAGSEYIAKCILEEEDYDSYQLYFTDLEKNGEWSKSYYTYFTIDRSK